MSYQEQICRVADLSMSDIIRISKEILPREYKSRPWEILDHGISIFTTDEQLCAYICAYAEMHWAKCRAALQNFPFEDLEGSFEVVDWGCGQGIASLSLVEMLREREKLNLLRKITLIEPSDVALNRALLNIDQATNNRVTILPLKKYLPYKGEEREIGGLSYECSAVVHLFSNILDINEIDLEKLAKIVGVSGRKHYIMCMGPKNSGAYRIDQFCSIFNPTTFISNIDAARYGYTSGTHHIYGCKTKCLLFENGTLSTRNMESFVAPTTIGGMPIYDDYDPRILQFNNITSEHIDKINILFGGALDSQDSIYIKPAINGDTPDMVVVRPNRGILIVNVCEGCSEEEIKRAAETMRTYQQNLVQLHIEDLATRALIKPANWSLIKMMLYFPNLSTKDVRGMWSGDSYIRFFGRELLESYNGETLLAELKFNYINRDFDDGILNSFIRIVSPKWHSYKQGKHIVLTAAQRPLAKSTAGVLRKINGVAGSGKTQVLATRAVNAHIRTGRPVLILTYNITLVNYLKHRINEVRADFSWKNIVVSNYHHFFKMVANNNGQKVYLSAFEEEKFFTGMSVQKYAAIFIDEVQDYKTEWLRILHRYFLEDNGEFVVFGDAKQNIYKRPLDSDGQIRLDFIRGGWNNSLTRSMRFANTQLANLADAFQREYFPNLSNDNITAEQTLGFDTCIKYWAINPATDFQTVSMNCRWIMQEFNLKTEDVVILSQYCGTIRNVDYAYRHQESLQTASTCESKEQYDELRKKFGIDDESQSLDFRFVMDLKNIRRNKRLHFSMDTNLVKSSTIHSFKGWEAKAVILVLTPNITTDESIEDAANVQSEESLIYTAITRAKEKLFILNMGNAKFDAFFRNYR